MELQYSSPFQNYTLIFLFVVLVLFLCHIIGMFGRTKRSLARDKYSGHHEEVLEAGDMSAPKPSMMSLSMTSSAHSDR